MKFSQIDLEDAPSLAKALAGCDLVVHTAGPFQRKSRPEVLEAAIQAKARQWLCDGVEQFGRRARTSSVASLVPVAIIDRPQPPPTALFLARKVGIVSL